jgi:hypothetical protein
MVTVECRNCGEVYTTALPLEAVRRVRRCRRCRRQTLVARESEPAERAEAGEDRRPGAGPA